MEQQTKTGKQGRENYSHAILDARKRQKREDAIFRQEEHNKLNLEEKIAKAKSRRGKSTKEIAKLVAMAAAQPKIKVGVQLTEAPATEKKTRTTKGKVAKAAKAVKPSKS